MNFDAWIFLCPHQYTQLVGRLMDEWMELLYVFILACPANTAVCCMMRRVWLHVCFAGLPDVLACLARHHSQRSASEGPSAGRTYPNTHSSHSNHHPGTCSHNGHRYEAVFTRPGPISKVPWELKQRAMFEAWGGTGLSNHEKHVAYLLGETACYSCHWRLWSVSLLRWKMRTNCVHVNLCVCVRSQRQVLPQYLLLTTSHGCV